MEWIDVLTPEGAPTEQVMTKAEVHAQGAWHRAAHVWVQNDQGHLLLQLRSPHKENDPNLWDVSVAGHVSAGESPRLSAQREVAEEIGLAITAGELQPLFVLREARTLNQGRYLDREFHHVFLLRRSPDLAQLTLQAEEVAAVRWVSLPQMATWVAQRSPQLVAHWEEYEALLRFLEAEG